MAFRAHLHAYVVWGKRDNWDCAYFALRLKFVQEPLKTLLCDFFCRFTMGRSFGQSKSLDKIYADPAPVTSFMRKKLGDIMHLKAKSMKITPKHQDIIITPRCIAQEVGECSRRDVQQGELEDQGGHALACRRDPPSASSELEDSCGKQSAEEEAFGQAQRVRHKAGEER